MNIQIPHSYLKVGPYSSTSTALLSLIPLTSVHNPVRNFETPEPEIICESQNFVAVKFSNLEEKVLMSF